MAMVRSNTTVSKNVTISTVISDFGFLKMLSTVRQPLML